MDWSQSVADRPAPRSAAQRDRVLVIDDDEIAGTVTTSLLLRAGYYAACVATPIGATQLIRSDHFSAVVCDLYMPAMRGDFLARLFRASPALQKTRLVLVSAAPQAELDEFIGLQGSMLLCTNHFSSATSCPRSEDSCDRPEAFRSETLSVPNWNTSRHQS